MHCGYLVATAWYFVISEKAIADERQHVVIRYAVFSLLFTVLLAHVFKRSYMMSSRGYVDARIFQAYSASLVLQARRGCLVFGAACVVPVAYYARLLSLYAEDYIPYRAVLAALAS